MGGVGLVVLHDKSRMMAGDLDSLLGRDVGDVDVLYHVVQS